MGILSNQSHGDSLKNSPDLTEGFECLRPWGLRREQFSLELTTERRSRTLKPEVNLSRTPRRGLKH